VTGLSAAAPTASSLKYYPADMTSGNFMPPSGTSPTGTFFNATFTGAPSRVRPPVRALSMRRALLSAVLIFSCLPLSGITAFSADGRAGKERNSSRNAVANGGGREGAAAQASAAQPGTQGAAPEGTPPASEVTPGEQGAPAYEYTEPVFGDNRVSYSFLVLRTLAILAVLVVAVYFVMRIFLKNRRKIVTGTDIIKVLATYPLAGNKSIQIMEIAEKVFILGVTESNINMITSVEDKETIDRIKLQSSKETKGGFQSFKDQLMKLISGKAFTGQGQISNFSDFKQRISKMRKR
jgi:flagellar biogenesis protein FliO